MPESFFENKEKRYEYFRSPEQRQDIYQFSKGVSEYLHEEKIPNFVIIDRSPRPLWVGIDEYWKEHYADEPRPNIYFVNPASFDTAERARKEKNFSASQMMFDAFMYQQTGTSEIYEKSNEIRKDLEERFEERYTQLKKDKDKPIALFDNCIHSGETLMPVLVFFDANGYEDIRVVIGETLRDQSNIVIDKNFTDKVKRVSCGAFGRDLGVEKDDTEVYSYLDKHANRNRVIQCRKEIRRIVKEKGV